MKRTAATVCLLFTSLSSVPALAELDFSDGWVRLPPPNARAVAGYGPIVNRGEATVRITDARAEGFGMAMLHETRLVDGISKMRHLDAVELEPGEAFELKPGGAHLMLMRPEAPVREGTGVVIELEVDGSWQRFELPVRRD